MERKERRFFCYCCIDLKEGWVYSADRQSENHTYNKFLMRSDIICDISAWRKLHIQNCDEYGYFVING